ncbi:hypothetical protein [Streptomyces sp. NBC_00503]|uniref:hypothetical protein n=1 Tax=Streptomyces sp. NBC_00503 TaxID=2903659 RepID=UPI002E81736D|nr:hypothetical protein [Streptomyces sp. NBC_00503]WUD85345.1 hypothetical protein OG490_34930 [Streptomyces sp. NBC_00503]
MRPTHPRPHGGWYAVPAVMTIGSLLLSLYGLLWGLIARAGKHIVCDSTTSCAASPYEAGYASPGWPGWTFLTAGELFALALLVCAGLFVARRGRPSLVTA